MKSLSAEPVLDAKAFLGESPIWDTDSQSLLWIDFPKQELHQFHPSSGSDNVISVEPTQISAIAFRRQGGLVVAADRGFGFFDLDSRTMEWIGTIERGDRMNDGACDPAGRFLAGSLSFSRKPEAALYRLEPDLKTSTVLTGVTLSNGIDWSPDGRKMYYVDTPTRRIASYDYDIDTGKIDRERIFADVSDATGNPDGLTVDAEGHIWVAIFRGSEVRRYDPNGKLIQCVRFPASLITSCCFGGPDLEDLFVTSATRIKEVEVEGEPLAGALFRVHTDTKGQIAHRFAG